MGEIFEITSTALLLQFPGNKTKELFASATIGDVTVIFAIMCWLPKRKPRICQAALMATLFPVHMLQRSEALLG